MNIEQKRIQISTYLRKVVRPFISPLVCELAKNRPTDILTFTKLYIQKLINEQNKNKNNSDSQQNNEDKDLIDIKYQQKLKDKKKNKKISRQAISAQAYGLFNKKQQYIPKIILKSNQVKNTIHQLLKQSVLFQTLNSNQINIVVDAMSVQKRQKGDQIIKEGQQGITLYVVGSGEYKCYKILNEVSTYLKTYKTGEYFGELALMYNAPRAATIVCSQSGVLYGLDRQTFKGVVEEAANKRRQRFRVILSKVDILSQIDPYERQQLCDILKQQSYSAGQYIVHEGDEGTKFYMIVSGKLIAQKSQKKVFQFKQGDYFGQISLIRNTGRQASIKCISQVKVVSIDRDTFKRMFGPIQNILKRNQEKYQLYVCS